MKLLPKQIAIFCAIAVGLSCIEHYYPYFIYSLFATPASLLAAFMTGSPLSFSPGGYILIINNYPVQVAQSCNGFGFFCMLIAYIVTFYLPDLFKAAKWQQAIFYMFATYLICVATNSCRIIASLYVYKSVPYLFSANYQAALHQGLGIIMFLTIFIIFNYSLAYIEQKKSQIRLADKAE